MCFDEQQQKHPTEIFGSKISLSRSRKQTPTHPSAHADDPIQNSTGDPRMRRNTPPRTPVAAGHDDPADVPSPGPGKAGSFPGTSPSLSLSLCPSSVDDGGKSCVVGEMCGGIHMKDRVGASWLPWQLRWGDGRFPLVPVILLSFECRFHFT
ncbi:hypothetical protein CEXT_296511 [Caerostris extrusa]|uniref:Uncharacterized protein n=1 Tax=Caerostris extrusa TaxID=172846 RepID=A0AAV4T464_CAEEX|nr:hypothetical protein CEXT_296511 [Caerostris extrusa]